jgi:hypothetical protein
MTRRCLHCEETFDDGEQPGFIPSGTYHLDCMLRMVVGGVNHQRGTCSCCSGGQDPPDPPSLSKREAARVAATYFRLHSAPGWDQ